MYAEDEVVHLPELDKLLYFVSRVVDPFSNDWLVALSHIVSILEYYHLTDKLWRLFFQATAPETKEPMCYLIEL
jgi:hypothetical protein